MLYKFTLMSNSTRHINYSALCLASYQSTIRSVPSSNSPQHRSCVQPRTDHRVWRKEAGVEAEEEDEVDFWIWEDMAVGDGRGGVGRREREGDGFIGGWPRPWTRTRKRPSRDPHRVNLVLLIGLNLAQTPSRRRPITRSRWGNRRRGVGRPGVPR